MEVDIVVGEVHHAAGDHVAGCRCCYPADYDTIMIDDNDFKALYEVLPDEVILNILYLLAPQEIRAISRTCRYFRSIGQENTLWKKMYEHTFGLTPGARRKKWYNDFRAQYELRQPGSMAWVNPKLKGTKPSPRYAHTGTVLDDKVIYIAGGVSSQNRFNDVYVYNPANGDMNQVAVKGVPGFSRHTSVRVGRRLFVFGGFDGVHTFFSLSMLDPESWKWSNLEAKGDIPPPRSNHAAAVVRKNLYVFGGNNNDEKGEYQILGDFYQFNTETRTWKKIQAPNAPGPRTGHKLVAIDNKLYLFGGGIWSQQWIKKHSDLYVFDTDTETWSQPTTKGDVPPCTFPIAYAVHTNLFVSFGGSVDNKVTRDTYVLDTLSMTWFKPVITGQEPDIRDMGTGSPVGDSVYFFGGNKGGAINDFNQLLMLWKMPPTETDVDFDNNCS